MTVSNNSLVINFKQLAEGTERPWSVYQYMKLREAAESILAGMDVAQPMEDFRESVTRSGRFLRLLRSVDGQRH